MHVSVYGMEWYGIARHSIVNLRNHRIVDTRPAQPSLAQHKPSSTRKIPWGQILTAYTVSETHYLHAHTKNSSLVRRAGTDLAPAPATSRSRDRAPRTARRFAPPCFVYFCFVYLCFVLLLRLLPSHPGSHPPAHSASPRTSGCPCVS